MPASTSQVMVHRQAFSMPCAPADAAKPPPLVASYVPLCVRFIPTATHVCCLRFVQHSYSLLLLCPAAVFVAAKNKMDLSLGVAIGSSVQVGWGPAWIGPWQPKLLACQQCTSCCAMCAFAIQTLVHAVPGGYFRLSMHAARTLSTNQARAAWSCLL
jgi:hypothetical protein